MSGEENTQKGAMLADYHPDEFLESPESQARLIDDALASGHAGYIADAIGTVARARGMSEVARLSGVSRQRLYAALNEAGNPTLETLLAVLKALEIELRAEIGKKSRAA
ncbi:MAG: addiction module antidote protein [Sphingomonadaceae bacterium]